MDRRDFLKLCSYGLLSQLIPGFIQLPETKPQSSSIPNILMIVFDAWSAKNISLYGYPRDTTPKINQLAERAIVYHSHYAGGPFTAPGVASILTGQYPWKHQVNICGQTLLESESNNNIFSLLKGDYFQVAYTHNSCADYLLSQQREEISNYLERSNLFLDNDIVFDEWFAKDWQTANIVKQLTIYRHIVRLQSSLFFQWIYKIAQYQDLQSLFDQYPRGLPTMGDSAQRFVLEDSINWISANSTNWPEPFFGYFHLLPPHFPYNTRSEFINSFQNDGFVPHEKPIHSLSPKISKEQREQERREYDEYIRLVDAEFARIYETLDQKGILENTWLILTSDHGESFERGEYHHTTKLLFDPVIQIPLLIFPPKLSQRIDIMQTTSAVDLMPTILELSQKEIPSWVDGIPLPLEETNQISKRPIFSMNFEHNPPDSPYTIGTVAMLYENYKIMKLIGYPELDEGSPLIEVYDLQNDPEELNNLVLVNDPIVKKLELMLDAHLAQENDKFL